MALRLRRDVQKASYYVWFLGAEEAKGLRGQRVINTVLPYLINRSRSQDSIKVTLQVSHKGIKIIQGSSKHFIPHSAITSSTQTDDIVACVLLLYNPATKCPLHVHAYRCDSETTAEALHQQLQILINRPENQKRFEELENRLGFVKQTSTTNNTNKLMNHRNHESNNEKLSEEKMALSQNQRQNSGYPLRQHELSPKRFNSSMGSDTGNSTRESECSDENIINSPVSRSPPIATIKSLPNPQQNNELFDSLAAELRAKLNGNGPPLLLPPRDYDTVHRSKGNLAAIELRRCRNALIVGNGNNTTTALHSQNVSANGKIISSRGSSGIGSDLAPSPERQELNSSSDEEPWTNEADSSVIALKPSQVSLERPRSMITPHHAINGKTSKQLPEDNYLRDLPAKPYAPGTMAHNMDDKITNERFIKNEVEPLQSPRVRGEDKIKPIIMRPADYDVKFSRILQSEQKPLQQYNDRYKHPESRDSNRILKKNHSLESEQLSQHIKHKSNNSLNDFDEMDHQRQTHTSYTRTPKESAIDKQKITQCMPPLCNKEKTSAKYAVEELRKYGGKQRYVDPADLPFQQNIEHTSRYTRNTHKSATHSPDHFANQYNDCYEDQRNDVTRHFAECEVRNYSRSKERNPYREPESQPYIESMEKMIKSSAIRYKSQETVGTNNTAVTTMKEGPNHGKIYQRNRTSAGHEETPENYNHNEYNRYKESKDKFKSIERAAAHYDMTDSKNSNSRASRRGSFEPRASTNTKLHNKDWSDEEPYYDTPPIEVCAKLRNREQWMEQVNNNRTINGRGETHVREASSRRSEPGEIYDKYDHNEHSKCREKFRDTSREFKRDYSPDRRSGSDNIIYRSEQIIENRSDMLYTQQEISNRSKVPNIAKGYRHSYAEPVFSRSAGRVGLAAVNPY